MLLATLVSTYALASDCRSGAEWARARRVAHERVSQAALLLLAADRAGDARVRPRQDDAANDLRLDHRPLRLLPQRRAQLAGHLQELHPPQPLAQQVLPQDGAPEGRAGQGRLLDPGRRLRAAAGGRDATPIQQSNKKSEILFRLAQVLNRISFICLIVLRIILKCFFLENLS